MASREEELEEQLEWEERKDSVPMHMHMLAGSCAGVAEHLCMFPIDTFKVRGGCAPFTRQWPQPPLAAASPPLLSRPPSPALPLLSPRCWPARRRTARAAARQCPS